MKVIRREPSYNLDLNKITWEATEQLFILDRRFIGTPNYMGLVFFWDYEYRHLLRDNRKHWVKVHKALLKEGLDVHATSDKHLKIICDITKQDFESWRESLRG